MSTRRSSGLHVGPGLSRVWWGFFPEYVGFFPVTFLCIHVHYVA